MPQLICKDAKLGYDGKAVVENLSFHVNEGDYLCIVGENGSGKSTLMKTMLRLMPPISGEVRAGDGLSKNEIGFLPQQTVVQRDFPASVREVVRSGCIGRSGFWPFYSATEKQLAEENMEKLGLTSIAKKCYRELSGGQQQRALLARALCATRKILLLDEPAAGLDPAAALELYDIIAELNKAGTTIIMISHDIETSVKYASQILHLGNKKALFFGNTSDYLESDAGRLYVSSGAGGGERI